MPEREAADRPTVSVVVPFAGSDAELRALHERLAGLDRGPNDEIIVSDNRSQPIRTPAFARNHGARQAGGEWLVFLDADTYPEPGLLNAYFDPPPAARTAVLAGAIRDDADPTGGLLGRYAMARGHMSQRRTMERPGAPYAQTANCAVRRSAFVSARGFVEDARAGEDADLCFRLAAAGWQIEARPCAEVSHRPRPTLRAWLGQLLIHGAGAAWLERRWPGEFPAPRRRSFLARIGRYTLKALGSAARGEVEQAAFWLLDLMGALAFELGRLLPNRRRAHV